MKFHDLDINQFQIQKYNFHQPDLEVIYPDLNFQVLKPP